MRSTLYSGLWRTALVGSQEVLALPVSDHMIVEQLEGHGLVSIGVPMHGGRLGQSRARISTPLAKGREHLVLGVLANCGT